MDKSTGDVLPRTSKPEGEMVKAPRPAKMYLLVGTVGVSCLGLVGLASYHLGKSAGEISGAAAAQQVAALSAEEQSEVQALVKKFESDQEFAEKELVGKEVQILRAADHPATQHVDEARCALALGTVTDVIPVVDGDNAGVKVAVDLPPTAEEIEQARADEPDIADADILGQQCLVGVPEVRVLSAAEIEARKADEEAEAAALAELEAGEEEEQGGSWLSKVKGFVGKAITPKNVLAMGLLAGGVGVGGAAIHSAVRERNEQMEKAAAMSGQVEAKNAKDFEKLSPEDQKTQQGVMAALQEFKKNIMTHIREQKNKYQVVSAVLLAGVGMKLMMSATPFAFFSGSWLEDDDGEGSKKE